MTDNPDDLFANLRRPGYSKYLREEEDEKKQPEEITFGYPFSDTTYTATPAGPGAPEQPIDVKEGAEELYDTFIEDEDAQSITSLEESAEWARYEEILDGMLPEENLVESLRAISSNTQDALTVAIKSQAWSPEQAQAWVKANEAFDASELEGFAEYADAALDYGINMITDPTAQIAVLTSVLTGGQSLTARQAMLLAANKVTSDVVKKTIAQKAGLFAAAESGVAGGVLDAAQQATDINIGEQEEFSYVQNIATAGAATLLGGAAGYLGGRYIDSRRVDHFMDEIEIPPNMFQVGPADEVIEVDGVFIPKDTKEIAKQINAQVGTEPLDDEFIKGVTDIEDLTAFNIKSLIHKTYARSFIGRPAGYLSEIAEHSPTAAKLIKAIRHDMSRPLRGPREIAGETVQEQVSKITGEYFIKFKKIIDPLKNRKYDRLDENINNRLISALRGKTTHTGNVMPDGVTPEVDTVIMEAAGKIRSIMNDMQAHAKTMGLDVGYQENYVPRKWNRIMIAENRDEFESLLVESGQAVPQLKNGEMVSARRVASNITDELLDKAHQARERTKKGFFAPERAFTAITDDTMFHKFLANDVEDIFNEYIINHGNKLGVTQGLGVKNLGEFKNKWTSQIDAELKQAGRSLGDGATGLTGAERNFIDNIYRYTASEDLPVLWQWAQTGKDIIATATQVALLPLATVSSLTELALPLLRANPSMVTSALKQAYSEAVPSAKHAVVTGWNRTLADANKKLGSDLLERLQVEHNLSRPEIWDTLNRFGIAMDKAASERVQSLGGLQVQNEAARVVQNSFFKGTLLTDWTKFVELTAFHTGVDVAKNNIKMLADDAGIKPIKSLIRENKNRIGLGSAVKFSDVTRETVEVPVNKMKAEKRQRLINELSDLGINLNEAFEWVRRGSSDVDPFNDKINQAAARFTGDVILHPNRTSGNRSHIMSTPGFDLVFQLMSYPAAFSNVVLKQMGRAMVADDALASNARLWSTVGIMTAAATVLNAARSQGESLDKDPEEIVFDSVARWGGNGIFLDILHRGEIGSDYVGYSAYATAATGPVISNMARALRYNQGPIEYLGSSFTPGYAAIDPILGKGKSKEYRRWLREVDKALFSKDSADNKSTKKRRGRFAEGGLVDPAMRRDPYTGRPYADVAEDLLDPLQRLGFVQGGYVRQQYSLGGAVIKRFLKHISKKEVDEVSDIAAFRASESLANQPLLNEDLDSTIHVSFMNSNKNNPMSTQKKRGTKDLGDLHKIIPLDSMDGQEIINKYGITPDSIGNKTHVVEIDRPMISKDESPIKTLVEEDDFGDFQLYTKDDILTYYNTPEDYRPFYAAKHHPEDKEFALQWRFQEDVDVYGKDIPQNEGAIQRMIDETAENGPLDREVLEAIEKRYSNKTEFVELLEESKTWDEESVKFINENIRPVPDSIVRRVRQTPKRIPKKSDVKEMEGAEYFNDKAFKDLNIGHASRETVILMSPDEYLKMAAAKDFTAPDSIEKMAKIRKYLDDDGLSTFPVLSFRNDGGGLSKVTGHEGRHRMKVFQERGVAKVPVKLISTEGGEGRSIRWSEQADPNSFDYVKDRPTKLVSEEGDKTIAFPDVFPTAEASPFKFLRGSKHKERVFRATTNDKPTRDMINAGENPREIGIHVADDPVQAEAILYADDVIRYVDNTTDRNLSAEARERMLAETDPEKMYGSALKEGKPITKGVKPDEFTRGDAPSPSISDYYISIKNPLLVDVDMPSGWAAQDLIPDMLGSSEFRSRLSRPTEIAEAVQKNINYGAVFGAEDAESIDLIQDYIITKARGSDTSGLVSELKSFSVDVDAVDSVVESYRVRVNKELHPLMQAIEKQLNRPIADTELEKLSEIDIPKEAYSDSARDKSLYEAAVYKANRELREWFESFGFDSIQYNNTIEAAGEGSSRKSWILFHSYQIKSARAESFDITDPRVSKAMGGLVRNRDKYAKGGKVDDPSMYRRDGSTKSAKGFLGPVENKVQGGTMTEVSVGIEIGGKEMEVPTMVPTLTPEEIDTLANMQLEGNAKNIPRSIIIKAKEHAIKRLKEGKSVYYVDGEEREEFSQGGMVPMPPEVMQPEAQEIVNPPLNQSNLQVGEQSDSASMGTGLIMRSLKRRFR